MSDANKDKVRLENELTEAVNKAVRRFEENTGLGVSEIDIERIETTTYGELANGKRNYVLGRIEVTIK